MHAMKFLKFLLILALSGPGAVMAVELSAEELNRIGQKLDTSPVLRGEFEQSKTLKGFKKPLVSRGNFVMARAKGVQWLTTQPFASTLVITADRLVTQGEGGAAQKMDTRQEPGLRAFNETLMAVLIGDVKVLATRFKVEGTQDASGWRLSLVPRDAALLSLIARIDIEGDQVVRAIQLHEGSGDTNRIRFFSHKNSALTTAEIGRF
ncbi:MAG: outer membrane lipoprotein carrier protein LolA [Rhodoferax sp.]|nr:outer membrane lipoprotein carrier protein LolA [Rhodoferax sp.]